MSTLLSGNQLFLNMITVAMIFLLSGLLIFGICQPLIRRKIRRNGLYGFRIPAAFESEERWYEINAYGGRQMAAWSWVITAAGVVGFFVPTTLEVVYALGTIPVTLVAVLVPVVRTLKWAGGKAV